MLQDSDDLSEYWMAIGQDRLTTSGLTQTSCSVSVVAMTALGDQTHKITIFRAVYDSEP